MGDINENMVIMNELDTTPDFTEFSWRYALVLYLSWNVVEHKHFFCSRSPGRIISNRKSSDKFSVMGGYKRYASVNILRDNIIGYLPFTR